jgi:hypothetical protein
MPLFFYCGLSALMLVECGRRREPADWGTWLWALCGAALCKKEGLAFAAASLPALLLARPKRPPLGALAAALACGAPYLAWLALRPIVHVDELWLANLVREPAVAARRFALLLPASAARSLLDWPALREGRWSGLSNGNYATLGWLLLAWLGWLWARRPAARRSCAALAAISAATAAAIALGSASLTRVLADPGAVAELAESSSRYYFPLIMSAYLGLSALALERRLDKSPSPP